MWRIFGTAFGWLLPYTRTHQCYPIPTCLNGTLYPHASMLPYTHKPHCYLIPTCLIATLYPHGIVMYIGYVFGVGCVLSIIQYIGTHYMPLNPYRFSSFLHLHLILVSIGRWRSMAGSTRACGTFAVCHQEILQHRQAQLPIIEVDDLHRLQLGRRTAFILQNKTWKKIAIKIFEIRNERRNEQLSSDHFLLKNITSLFFSK